MTQNFNILSCDGGGIRGLLTALILEGLPASAISNAQVFAGTSTGGILSIGLAAGRPIDTLVNLYSSQCSTIFAQTPAASDDQIFDYLVTLLGSKIKADAMWGLIKLGLIPRTLFSAKWSNASLASQLQTTLGDSASSTFADLGTKLFITTFQLDDGGSQWQPISIDNLGSPATDSTLLDAAMATSAAPTFFPPYFHPTLGYCVDGGTFANDPSLFALSRVLQSGVPLDSIRVLSIGTGATVDGIPSSYFGTVAPELWGAFQYMFPVQRPATTPTETLISLLMDGSSQVDDSQTQAVLPSGNYLRVQVPLPGPIPLDDCSQVQTLKTCATDFMKQPQWSQITDWVTQNFI